MTNLGKQGSDTRPPKLREEWRPRLELSEDGGYLVSSPRETPIDDAVELLAEFDLDPTQWRVTSVRKSKWQRYDEEWLHSYRVNVVPATMLELVDWVGLDDEIRKWKPRKAETSTGTRSFVVAVGDTQWGKDAGDGTSGTVDRMMSALEAVKIRHKELRNRNIGEIVLAQMGDCIEGVVSQGGKIAGRLDLPLTAQIRLGRRVLFEWVKALAPLTDRLVIPVVPGNHDESHRQLITDPQDSFQVEIVSQVLDMCRENPNLSHVEERFPERDNTTLTIETNGTLLGLAHGHQTRQASKWWEGQALGNTPIGAADILITAHYHHYKVEQLGERLWIQIPSMDGGSPWFKDRRGFDSPHGVVSFVTSHDYDARKDLAVLT